MPKINIALGQISQLSYTEVQYMCMQAKNIVITLLVLALAGAVAYLFINNSSEMVFENTPNEQEQINPTEEATPATEENKEAVAGEEISNTRPAEEVLGTSVNGNEITAYHFGTGPEEILFVGDIHGGYSWNTALLAYDLIDYLDTNPQAVPENLTVTVIPTLNPDGLKATVGTVGRFSADEASKVSETKRVAGRFNANKVDLNRNFDCEWSPTGNWKTETVSGGEKPFSEPETQAIRDYIETHKPTAAVVWFSAEGKVYPSACEGVPSKDSITLAATFAQAAGYGTAAKFDAYTITGDMVNWMAKQGIPAISVLLSDHQNVEWEKNKAGIEAVLKAYAN